MIDGKSFRSFNFVLTAKYGVLPIKIASAR
jgi:hypothetical protein